MLIFKGSDSGFLAQMAATFSDDDKRWGHAGIIVRYDGDWSVVHASGGPGMPDSGVRVEPLDAYLGDVKTLGLFAYNYDDGQRQRLVDWAAQMAAQNHPFDAGFSLESEDAYYCTELIWAGLKYSTGQDPVPEKSHWRSKIYVSLSDLTTADGMRELYAGAVETAFSADSAANRDLTPAGQP